MAAYFNHTKYKDMRPRDEVLSEEIGVVMLGQRSGENGQEVVDIQLEGVEIGHHQLHTRQPCQIHGKQS
jgi:hypothetical protein